MLELLLIITIGLFMGIIVGLIPGIPSFLGTIFLYPFINNLTIDQILAFWLAIQIGSQYFGSVAAILLKIPGEASSMVYIKDIDKISITDRYALVRQTAWGSTTGSVVGLAILVTIYYFGLGTHLVQLSNNTVKLCVLTMLIGTLIYFSKHKLLSILLFLVGISLTEKTNQNFPKWIFDIQDYTSDITMFSLLLGLLIIPEFIHELINKKTQQELKLKLTNQQPINWYSIGSGTWIGSLAGLIPGPSSVISSMLAYNYKPKDNLSNRIIRAESANNSATITSLLPLLFIGLPITLSEILLVDIFQMKLFNLPSEYHTALGGLNLIEFCFIIIAAYTLVYHFLAQKFLTGYKRLIELAHGKLLWLYLIIISYIIYIDVHYTPVNLFRYFVFGILITVIGYQTLKKDINVLPLIFGYLLGDMIIWTVYHFYMINFY